MPRHAYNALTNGPSTPRNDAQRVAPKLPQVRVRTRQGAVAPPQLADIRDQPANADYEVGYRKPPVHSRFKPGQSGNPSGRPKAAKSVNTIIRETLTAKIDVRTAAGAMRMTRIEAVIHKILDIAMKGDRAALLKLVALYESAVPEADTLSADPSWPGEIALMETIMAELISSKQHVP